MPQFLIHHKGAYNFFSTVSDGACFVSALTLEQVKEFTQEEYGKEGMRKLPDRLDRVHRKGCSSMDDLTLSGVLVCNRAGEN